ncbi:MAG: tripartite tricarboxylate transporter substrate binding protein [Actinomycetota bacterium]|nr:tripartite tricarboxylate transporter substrate binding protein [Actinomycetota bacterium]
MTRRDERRARRRAATLLPVVGLLAAACGGGEAGSGGGQAAGGGGGTESCYEGETATFVVPFSPGGGYDVIARGLQPFLEEELGATVVVENQTGAGGLKAANNLYTTEGDGLTFGLFAAQGIVGSALAEASGASYDPKEFTYVARLAQDSRVLLASPQSGLTSIDDVLAADQLQYATAGTGAADHIDGNVVPTVLGIEDKVQVVTGFEGSSETELAVTSGEVELGSGTLGTRINGIKNGDQIPILLMGRERAEELPDVPALLELDLENPDLAEAYIGLQEVGRSVFAPPGVPENCLTELQDALRNTLENPEFQTAIGDSVDVPFEYTDGEGLRAAVDNVLGAPEELVALLKKAYADQ